jgi:hypothetical protein
VYENNDDVEVEEMEINEIPANIGMVESLKTDI